MKPSSPCTPMCLLAALLLLAGCEKVEPATAIDQCMRREIFFQCMAALPKGPERVSNSNDWSEVVDSCDGAARYQSYRRIEQIKPECRP